MKTCRQSLMLLASLGVLCIVAWTQSQSIVPERKGDYIHVTVPGLHFLSGKALEKLQNGSTITYVLSLSAFENARRPAARTTEEYVISFDLWEEKYSVVQRKSGGRSVSRVAAPVAEAWCVEGITIPIRSIPERQPFMLRFECSTKENSSGTNRENHSTLTLAGLIDVFSRKKNEEPLGRWEAVAGPFRLTELKK